MNALPLQFLMLLFAGWVDRHQKGVIEYLQAENRALRDQLGGKRLRFTDQQRRRLAVKAKAVGRKGLFEIDTLVTPDTLLRWHRQLIARKYDGSKKRLSVLNIHPKRFGPVFAIGEPHDHAASCHS